MGREADQRMDVDERNGEEIIIRFFLGLWFYF